MAELATPQNYYKIVTPKTTGPEILSKLFTNYLQENEGKTKFGVSNYVASFSFLARGGAAVFSTPIRFNSALGSSEIPTKIELDCAHVFCTSEGGEQLGQECRDEFGDVILGAMHHRAFP